MNKMHILTENNLNYYFNFSYLNEAINLTILMMIHLHYDDEIYYVCIYYEIIRQLRVR